MAMATNNAATEESITRFVEILASGGVLVAHPDTIAEWKRGIASSPLLVAIVKSVGREIEYVPNQYVEPGTLYACVRAATNYTDPVWHGRAPYVPLSGMIVYDRHASWCAALYNSGA